MKKQLQHSLHESRSARCNATVNHPARWRLITDTLFSSANRVHRYRDLSRRILEDALDSYHGRKPCT